jgi:SAM-dependent methyltransferase
MPLTLIVQIALAIGIVVLLTRQCRKPAGWPGRLFAWGMNRSHSALTDWGLAHITIDRRFRVLDIGCGGGRTIQKLAAAAAEGKVFGVDYARTCVAASRASNAGDIAAGRVEIQEGSVSHLPYPDAGFDLITAVETHYYWPDLAANVREIRRVLKPGGRLVIIAELYRRRPLDLNSLIMKPLGGTVLSADDHRVLLSTAGYTEIDVQTSRQGWICAIGRRPVAG